MSLREIVKALGGGDIYHNGRSANVPAPGHSPTDRSVSLTLNNGRVVIHCFSNRDDWRAVADFLRDKNLIDAQNRPTGASGSFDSAGDTPLRTTLERQQAASRLWERGRPITRTLGERHCRLRKISRVLPGPETLRFSHEVPISAYRGAGRTKPALMAGVRNATGELTAVELHYLDPSGHRAAGLRLSRKTIGIIPIGSAIRLDPLEEEMLVGEGVFTTLSASQRFGLPAWALLSVGLMQHWTPPAGVRRLLVAGDHGKGGPKAAQAIVERARHAGIHAEAVFPDNPAEDWNDAAPPLSPAT